MDRLAAIERHNRQRHSRHRPTGRCYTSATVHQTAAHELVWVNLDHTEEVVPLEPCPLDRLPISRDGGRVLIRHDGVARRLKPGGQPHRVQRRLKQLFPHDLHDASSGGRASEPWA
jgi:hypothetical protein